MEFIIFVKRGTIHIKGDMLFILMQILRDTELITTMRTKLLLSMAVRFTTLVEDHVLGRNISKSVDLVLLVLRPLLPE